MEAKQNPVCVYIYIYINTLLDTDSGPIQLQWYSDGLGYGLL